MTFRQITAPEDLDKSVGVFNELLKSATGTASWEKRYVRKDGSLTWARLKTSTQRDGQGRSLHLITIVEDINARKTAEERLAAAQEALRVSEARYRTVFQTSPNLIDINRLDDGTYIDANKAYLDILGFEREEVIGRTSWELNIWADPRDRQNFVELLRQNSNCRNLEANLRRKNGEIFSALISAARIELDGVSCIVSITRDMSAAKAAENTIRNLAFYDPLTGLPNRRLLMDRLRQALAASAQWDRSQALLLIDLDNLKMLNETLGHQTGDYLLQEFARRLAACVRDTDTVARLGGDEFVVMLEDLSEVPEEAAAEAKAVCEKILASVGQPYLFNDRECLSSASIGIAVFGDRQNSMDDILQQADIALHQAKAAGRNTVRFFSPALQTAVNARAALEEDLRKAIKTNQFLLYYQPQVELGRLTGAEALIRWKHPLRGIVPPDEFIPLAEETGLILPLGEWVLENACTQIASWAGWEQTADFTVAVNISALQLRQPDFVEGVLAALDRTGANPKRLRLELTESMLVENLEEVIAKMTQLRSHGLRFALDDFGTGYSSLAYLKRLPLDRLKIDRVFVRDILVDSSSGAIAQTILSLGRAMGLPVIAEGVETEEQLAFLAGLGCQSFQGYLFSRPLPLKEFQAFLQNFGADAEPLRQ
jgi:diguanylate cyclase (GGDEF)-like protein/PAS domain S-box-containing protein